MPNSKNSVSKNVKKIEKKTLNIDINDIKKPDEIVKKENVDKIVTEFEKKTKEIKKAAPIIEKKAAPVIIKKVTPVIEKKVTPVIEKKVTPVIKKKSIDEYFNKTYLINVINKNINLPQYNINKIDTDFKMNITRQDNILFNSIKANYSQSNFQNVYDLKYSLLIRDILTDAINIGLERIMIIHDTVSFNKDFNKLSNGLIESLQQREWNTLLLGTNNIVNDSGQFDIKDNKEHTISFALAINGTKALTELRDLITNSVMNFDTVFKQYIEKSKNNLILQPNIITNLM